MNANKYLALAAFVTTCAVAQTPPAPPEGTDINAVASLSWLNGCWGGTVNKRDFREQWAPVRGNTMIGMSSTVFEDKLQNYEYLRIEARADGVYYVALPSGKQQDSFKLTSIRPEERDGATFYTFENQREEFPQRIVYRRGTEGWLYATIEGKLNGQDRQQTFPMRRMNCETGEFNK